MMGNTWRNMLSGQSSSSVFVVTVHNGNCEKIHALLEPNGNVCVMIQDCSGGPQAIHTPPRSMPHSEASAQRR